MNLRGWCRWMKNHISIKDGFNFLNKSKIKAGDGLSEGDFPFYTSSSIQSKFLNDYEIEDESLIFGTGGSASIHYSKGKFSTSTDCFVIQSNNKYGIDLKYVYFYLFGNIHLLENGFKGAGLKHISKKYLEEIKIPLVPLETQKKIVEALDKAQTLIDARKEQIRLMDELVKARFVEMFGDPVINPMNWDIKTQGEFTEFLTSGSRGWSEYFSNEGKMFLTIKNVKNSKIDTSNIQYVNPPETQEAVRTKVKEKDLLISITADLGRTGVITKEIAEFGAYINQHLSLVRVDTSNINPLYISYYLESDSGRKQFESKNQSAVKAGLNFNAIRSLNLLVPPLELQNEFEKYVQQIENSKLDMQTSLNEIITTQQALMQQYFG